MAPSHDDEKADLKEATTNPDANTPASKRSSFFGFGKKKQTKEDDDHSSESVEVTKAPAEALLTPVGFTELFRYVAYNVLGWK